MTFKFLCSLFLLTFGFNSFAQTRIFYCLTSDSRSAVKIWLQPESVDKSGKIVNSKNSVIEFISDDFRSSAFGGLISKDAINLKGTLNGDNFQVSGTFKNSKNSGSLVLNSYKKSLKFQLNNWSYSGPAAECEVVQ